MFSALRNSSKANKKDGTGCRLTKFVTLYIVVLETEREAACFGGATATFPNCASSKRWRLR